jgi:hypothetical protein
MVAVVVVVVIGVVSAGVGDDDGSVEPESPVVESLDDEPLVTPSPLDDV